jgi:competence protein ComEC
MIFRATCSSRGIGASGFAMGAIKSVEPPERGGFALRYASVMQGLRDAIDARIHNQLDGDKRAIATALLTGRRDAITEPVNDAMFISGLGHVLSISGYHMAVVAVRALLALIPRSRSASRSRSGRRRPPSLPRLSISSCRAQRSRPNDRSS